MLNHAHTVTAKRYNRMTYLPEKRDALTRWDDELQQILTGEPRKTPRVLPMRTRS